MLFLGWLEDEEDKAEEDGGEENPWWCVDSNTPNLHLIIMRENRKYCMLQVHAK